MFTLSRRTLFATMPPLFALSALAACGTSSSAGLTLDQAIADALGTATTLKAELPIIATLFPKLFTSTPIISLTNAGATGWLDIAIQDLTGLASTSTVAVTSLATAEQDINLALNVLSSIAQSVASANPSTAAVAAMVEAAISLAPAIEALIAQLSATVPLVAPVHAAAVHLSFAPQSPSQLALHVHQMPAAQARSILHVKIVD